MKQITCPHCADTYPDFDVAHVCSRGPYAPKIKPKMNIQTVAENLRATIAGKEQLVAHYREVAANQGNALDNVNTVFAVFVQDNINELRRILKDVEQCVKKESDDSWITNPDRIDRKSVV